MRYFELKYIITENGIIINQGNALYYTSAEQNTDEMKKVVREIVKDPRAIVSIPLVTEIHRDIFVQKGGNPDAL
jgi:hypothetical protein